LVFDSRIPAELELDHMLKKSEVNNSNYLVLPWHVDEPDKIRRSAEEKIN
jgi:hypothetical protein